MFGFANKFALRRFTRWHGLALSAAAAGVVGYFFQQSGVNASASHYVEDNITPPHYRWYHEARWVNSYDHFAVRRGFQVYNTIGKACHSMQSTRYRSLIEVAYTAEEVAAIAAENEGYKTEPNDEGEVFERTGTPNDEFWRPFANEQEARAANNGALPPDLTLIVNASEHHEDYIFSLLTGYRDAPHGVTVAENMYYNPYFPGCQISMPPPLAAGAVDYDDGTDSSVCQMAKDVTTFLAWSGSKELDERHLQGLKGMTGIFLMVGIFFFVKKGLFNIFRNRKISFNRTAIVE